MDPSNTYLDQVVQEQAKVEGELKRWRHGNLAPAAPAPVAQAATAGRGVIEFQKGVKGIDDHGGVTAPLRAVDYRITGFWIWRNVIVPPNVYVVHTRRGQEQPIHIGMGISFRYNPWTDAFMVIPAAVQTLLINARCICAERQGVLVQAYVQWIVDDIAIACRKLDFSDPEDPMRIVNVQLREQAEAAIKDKVATMSIDAILSDKQPIIEELTLRLRGVAEGSRENNATGLGLKIVTVQIKEAVVSSTRLWENLQKPFRAEREKLARLAELDAQQQIARQELTNRQATETAQMEYNRRLAQLQATQEREQYDLQQNEKNRRHQVEQESETRAIAERTATDKTRKEAELDLALHQLELDRRRLVDELETLRQQAELERAKAEREKQRTAASVEVENLVHQAQTSRAERDVELFQLRREIENNLSESHVRSQLIARLPDIAQSLPKPDELRAVNIGPDSGGTTSSLVGFLASLLQVAEATLKRAETANGMKPE